MLVLIVQTLTTIHEVPFWTDDYGYCKQIPGYAEGVHRPYGLQPMTIEVGDSLEFMYSVHHDVWHHPTLESLESCDYSGGAYQLAGREAGGGCEDETDHYGCMAQAYMSGGYVMTPDSPGTWYLSCSVGDHCRNGQRLVVTVEDRSKMAWHGGLEGAYHHVVPFWTDDYGYCEKIRGYPEGVHRPDGLTPLAAQVNQPVLFTYSTHHDVWQHASRAHWLACNYTGAVMLADRHEGGGCEDETDAACMAAATPFVLTPSRAGNLFLSCSVGDHCVNGQRIEITVYDHRTPPPPSPSPPPPPAPPLPAPPPPPPAPEAVVKRMLPGETFLLGAILGGLAACLVAHRKRLCSAGAVGAMQMTTTMGALPRSGGSDDPTWHTAGCGDVELSEQRAIERSLDDDGYGGEIQPAADQPGSSRSHQGMRV